MIKVDKLKVIVNTVCNEVYVRTMRYSATVRNDRALLMNTIIASLNCTVNDI